MCYYLKVYDCNLLWPFDNIGIIAGAHKNQKEIF